MSRPAASFRHKHPRYSWMRADLGLGRNNGLLFWSTVFWGAGFNLQFVLWALFAEHLGASPGQIGLVLGGSAVARMLLAVPAGALADRMSPKPVIFWTMLVSVPGALVFALAGAWWHALVAAVLVECSAAGVPATSAMIARAPTERERTRAYTWVYNVAFGISGIIAPATGGWLADLAGFRPVFVLSSAFFVVGALFVLGLGDPGRDEREGIAGRGQSAIGYRALLGMAPVLVMLALNLLVPFVLGVGTALQPNFLQDERGLRVGTIGTLGSVAALAGLVISLIIAHWRRMPGPFAGLAACIAMVAVSFALLAGSSRLGVIVLAFVLRAGFGATWPLLSSAMASATPAFARGRAYGLAEFSIGAGDVAAPIAAGQLYALDHSLPLTVAAIMSAPMAVATLAMHRARDRLRVAADGAPADQEPAAAR